MNLEARARIKVQSRDLALLRGLFECRIITAAHIAVLYFEGKAEATKKRVQKLKSAGYIAERPRRASDPAILFLTLSGFKLLSEQGHLSDYPRLSPAEWRKRSDVSDLTIRHELAVIDTKCAIVSAVNRTDRFRIAEFSTWPLLHEFQIRKSALDPTSTGELTVKPDGFLRIRETGVAGNLEYTFFIEVDRGNENLQRLVDKALCYREFYKSGGFAERSGGSKSDIAQYPFRVLFVLHSEKRRDNVATALLAANPPIRRMVWLTTMHEITTSPLGNIWIVPQSIREPDVATNLNLFDDCN